MLQTVVTDADSVYLGPVRAPEVNEQMTLRCVLGPTDLGVAPADVGIRKRHIALRQPTDGDRLGADGDSCAVG
jgi:hypothetical protein